MKITTISHMVLKEYKKHFLFSISMFIILDFIYINFVGLSINRTNAYMFWIGGYENIQYTFATALLKISNIALIFLTIGRVVEKTAEDIMVYILPRVGSYGKFIRKFTFVILMFGIMMILCSHIIYYLLAGILLSKLKIVFLYFAFDIIGFVGIILLYMILNNVYQLENSLLYIIGLYVVNTILPFPMLIATSTIQFIKLKNQIGIVFPIIAVIVIDILLFCCYGYFIKKRSVSIC